MVVSRFIHISASDTDLLLCVDEKYSVVYMFHIFFINSSVDGHLDCLHVPILNSAAMNIAVYISFHIMGFYGCMTNLDSIFKSRDVTLPTKVHLVKAMVFPVVMYG